MFCQGCGVARPDGARYCADCGTSFEAPAAVAGPRTNRTVVLSVIAVCLTALVVTLVATRDRTDEPAPVPNWCPAGYEC